RATMRWGGGSRGRLGWCGSWVGADHTRKRRSWQRALRESTDLPAPPGTSCRPAHPEFRPRGRMDYATVDRDVRTARPAARGADLPARARPDTEHASRLRQPEPQDG